MAQYKTTNGRPVSFKFGPVTIRVGKKPAEIDSKYAKRILNQYPGWIERVGPKEIDIVELAPQTQETEAGATAETAGDDHQDVNLEAESQAAENSEPEASNQETETPTETVVDDQPKAMEPDRVPTAAPVPAAKKTSTGKKPTGKKAATPKA